jgi:hypothetical protein
MDVARLRIGYFPDSAATATVVHQGCLSLIPIALTGPFVMNVATARCPHCQRPLHRNIFAIFGRLDRCARCGFPRLA